MAIKKATTKITSSPVKLKLAPTLNVKQQVKRRSKAQENALKMRQLLWPEVQPHRLWHRALNDGFTTVPRTLPLFMNIINDLSKSVADGKSVPAGRSYLVLWCRVFDESLVKIDNEATVAGEAGYGGERNISTWREHLRVLKALGFIDYKEGAAGPNQFVLMFNPYQVVEARKSDIPERTFAALYQRALEIGAGDEFKMTASTAQGAAKVKSE